MVQRKYLKGFSDSILSEMTARDFLCSCILQQEVKKHGKWLTGVKSLCAGNNGYVSKLWEKA